MSDGVFKGSREWVKKIRKVKKKKKKNKNIKITIKIESSIRGERVERVD